MIAATGRLEHLVDTFIERLQRVGAVSGASHRERTDIDEHETIACQR